LLEISKRIYTKKAHHSGKAYTVHDADLKRIAQGTLGRKHGFEIQVGLAVSSTGSGIIRGHVPNPPIPHFCAVHRDGVPRIVGGRMNTRTPNKKLTGVFNTPVSLKNHTPPPRDGDNRGVD
jgi:hypothetical protein